jgi:hypothetical protein
MSSELIVRTATGVLKGLYHNSFNFLSSCNGKYSSEKWEAYMIEATKHCVACNIMLSESILGRVDYFWRIRINFHMSTASGLVMARHGKLFDNVPSYWTDGHTKALIAFVKKNHCRFQKEEADQVEKQKRFQLEKLKEKELKAENKILRESLSQISYFTIHTLKTIKTAADLDTALDSLKTVYEKVDLLKNLICMWATFGHSDISTQFSKADDKTFGKYNNLLDRARAILSRNLTISIRPALRSLKKTLTPEDFGLTPLQTVNEFVVDYDTKLMDQITKVLQLDEDYGIKILFAWNSINRQYWDVSLTELQKKITVGRIFHEDGKLYKVLGLSWDTDENQYAAYYHLYDPSQTPPTLVKDPEDIVETSFFKSVPDIYAGIESWDITRPKS